MGKEKLTNEKIGRMLRDSMRPSPRDLTKCDQLPRLLAWIDQGEPVDPMRAHVQQCDYCARARELYLKK